MHTSLPELEVFARKIVENFPTKRGGRAHIIGVSGELGAGKTTLVQMIAKHLGVTESVQSPTFVIVKIYGLKHDVYDRLVHIDAYRLTMHDNDFIDFTTYLEDEKNLIFVEWPEHISLFPKDASIIKLELSGENDRKISMI